MAGHPGAGQISHVNPKETASLPPYCSTILGLQVQLFLCGHPLSPSPPQTQSELLEFASILLAITSLRSVVATLRTDPLDPLDALTTTFALGSVGGASLAGKASLRLFLRPGRGFRESQALQHHPTARKPHKKTSPTA